MVSPARGLLIYSPFLILAPLAFRLRQRSGAGLEVVALAVVIGLWLITANTHDWPGGYSYGPRLLADALPWLVLLMAPVADAVTAPLESWTAVTRVAAAALAITFGWSLFVNARGALSWSTQAWNAQPVDAGVDTHPGRFWDWGDPPFFRADHKKYKDIYPWNTPPAGVASGQQCRD
jgi:hypothetical protein